MYNTKTKYPKEESVETQDAAYVTTRREKNSMEIEGEEVIRMYTDYLRAGYKVNVQFDAPKEIETDITPFEIAQQLTEQGIDYTATLKIKNKSEYDDAVELGRAIEFAGFDYDATVTMKINEDSSINLEDETTWPTSDDAKFKVTPKAKSDNINELQSLYERLEQLECDVVIDIKPKKDKDAEDDAESFATQLLAFPEGTTVVFTLQDSEY